MEKTDYTKIGFKSGLEIHQQLDTNKLFCNCSSLLRSDEPDFAVKRKLHVVAGETGEVDVAASHEASKNKEFIYQGYNTTCLVEIDEEPPHEINKEALKIALQISLLLNCQIIPITQVMRKTVIDGSNTSGFQRTVLIARDGWIETSQGNVRIESVCLEEDAARIIKRDENSKEVIYRLDRLGIPLIEIATAPDIKNPIQAKETALHLGNILRNCKVKRGIGTIRQDVNLSIKNSKRIEIKGFQDIKNIERAIEKEVERQSELVGKGKSVAEVRNVLYDGTSEFLRPLPGKARMYPETDIPLLKISKQFIDEVKKTLPKLKDETEGELKKQGLSDELVSSLLKGDKLDNYKELINLYKNPQLIAKMLVLWPKEIASKKNKSIEEIYELLNIDILNEILGSLKSKKINELDIKDIMLKLSEGKSLDEILKIEKVNLNDIEEEIIKIIKNKPGLSDKAYMGLIMEKFRGKINGKDAIEIVKKHIK